MSGSLATLGVPSTTAVTQSLPPAKQGVASAMNDTARELGSALGIAVLGSTLTQAYRDGMVGSVAGLPSQVADYVLRSVSFTQAPELARLGERGKALADMGRQSFVLGLRAAFLVAAAMALVALVAVAILAPRHTPPSTPPPER